MNDIFKKLGKEAWRLPADNESLKLKVLATVRPQLVNFRKPIRLWRMALAGVAAVILLLLVGPYVYQKINPSVQPVYYGGGGGGGSMDLGISIAQPTGIERTEDTLNKAISVLSNALSINPVIDTREFLKVGYNATIKTREVEKLSTRVQTMVRGYGGRIDNASLGDKSAYISFVVPKSSLESFKSELKDLVPARFFTENIKMQNYLPNKQSIENQTDQTNQNLQNLQDRRQALVDKHNTFATSLQRQIDNYSRSIYSLKQEVTTDTVRQQEIVTQIARLTSQQQALKRQLATENSQFKNTLATLDSNISYANSRLLDLDKQDQDLLNDVETVQGTASLQWISILNMINLYVPIYWILVLSCVFTIIVYLFYGRESRAFEMP